MKNPLYEFSKYNSLYEVTGIQGDYVDGVVLLVSMPEKSNGLNVFIWQSETPLAREKEIFQNGDSIGLNIAIGALLPESARVNWSPSYGLEVSELAQYARDFGVTIRQIFLNGEKGGPLGTGESYLYHPADVASSVDGYGRVIV